MDDMFLMRLAKLRITSAELLQLCVFLQMKTSTVREIQHESEDAVTRAFTLLEKWTDSSKTVSYSAELFDQLSGACVEINRADLVEYVRCEQIRILNERLKKAKVKIQMHRKNSNEQMRLVKHELREAIEEKHTSNEDLNTLRQSQTSSTRATQQLAMPPPSGRNIAAQLMSQSTAEADELPKCTIA